jgi:hypothetical protein
MLGSHPGTDMLWVQDSLSRVERIRQLADRLPAENVTKESIQTLLCDEEKYPCSINRAQEGESDASSVFSISMDLTNAEALVKLGRPSKPERSFMLQPRAIRMN